GIDGQHPAPEAPEIDRRRQAGRARADHDGVEDVIVRQWAGSPLRPENVAGRGWLPSAGRRRSRLAITFGQELQTGPGRIAPEQQPALGRAAAGQVVDAGATPLGFALVRRQAAGDLNLRRRRPADVASLEFDDPAGAYGANGQRLHDDLRRRLVSAAEG